MQKHFPKALLSLLLCVPSLSAWCDHVDVEAARKIAEQSGVFQRALPMSATSDEAAKGQASASSVELVYTLSGDAHEPLLYVFSPASQSGFVVVAADDAVAPIVGYSASQTFDRNALPQQLQALLHTAGRHVAQAAKGMQSSPAQVTPAARPAIAPLLGDIRWGQDVPYNSKTPVINGKNAPTGCVATALAQIMYYHKFPQRATGTAFYKFADFFKPGQTIVLGEKGDFAWNLMKPSYPRNGVSEEERDAVGQLLLEIGAATQMRYDLQMSGSTGVDGLKALREHFGYTKAQLVRRMNRTAVEWENIIYHELEQKRPVFLAGASGEIAHAYVCDGYDGKGFYHINWGWDGMADGYFNFSFLAPPFYGTGSKDRDIYVVDLEAIVGMARPETVELNIPLYEILGKGLEKREETGSATPQFWIRGVRLAGYQDIDADFSLAIREDNGTLRNVGKRSGWAIKKDLTYNKIDVAIDEQLFPQGKHAIVPIFAHRGSDNWQEIPLGRYFEHSIVVNRTETGMTVEENKTPLVLETTVQKTIAFNFESNTLAFRVKNLGSTAYSSFVSVCFGDEALEKGSKVERDRVARNAVSMHLEPGEVRDFLVDYTPYADQGFYASITYDPTNGLGEDEHIVPTMVLSTHRFEVKSARKYRAPIETSVVETDIRVRRNEPLHATVRTKASDSENFEGAFARMQLWVTLTSGSVQHKFPEFEVLLDRGQAKEFPFEGVLPLEEGDYTLVVTHNVINDYGRKEYKPILRVPFSIVSEEEGGGSISGLNTLGHATSARDFHVVQGVLQFAPAVDVSLAEVYNLSGQRMASTTQARTISLTHLPKGVYVVKYFTAEGAKTSKLSLSY